MDEIRKNIELQALASKVKRMEDGSYDAPITNTSGMHAAEHLLDVMNAGNGGEGFIEAMESAGQAEMVKAAGSRLPADGILTGSYGGEPFDWSQWGIKVGEVVKGDEIWVEAELPEGWKLDGSDHAMWSYLHDEQGRERAAIFYKAAFYDRSCSITPSRRYKATTEAVTQRDRESPYFAVIMDGKKEIHRLGPFENEEEAREGNGNYKMSAYSVADEAGRAWMNEKFPNNGDPAAYWDDE